MSNHLTITLGQCSDKGRKETNQDFHGAYIPNEPQLSTKGIAIALADGISSSSVSHIASQAAIKSFLDDYFCTSDAWSVKRSAQCILNATNSWLYAQTQQSPYRYDKDKGYVCTLSALIIKSTTAHLFHVGDSRIYRVHAQSLEQLTNDHRIWISQDTSHLARAMGINAALEIDYQALPVEKGDTFLLATDGVYEFASVAFITTAILRHANDLDAAAQAIVDEAYARGSTDNLTVQIVRIESLSTGSPSEISQQLTQLPVPPLLEARMQFDGYTVIREVHASSRSHVYLASDNISNERVIIKIPSLDLRGDPMYLERFLMEDWIARRLDSAHVLKPCAQTRKRNYLYIVTEYIEGQSLAQWMIDKPKADLETVRDIVEQIAKGLLAFHRKEMLHQDLRPANIMIDQSGTVKIIDFGSTRVAGLVEITTPVERNNLLGTAQYTAPEYFLGESGSPRSDLFSLAVITYQLLSGKLPYGAEVAKSRTVVAQRNLHYDSVLQEDREIPGWIDEVLKKAVHPDPAQRYEELSEFIYDLRHPNKAYLSRTRRPLIERNPTGFWQGVSLVLALIIAVLLFYLHQLT